jgi:hypothetical protein
VKFEAYSTSGNLFGFPEKQPNEVIAEAFRERLQKVAGFKYVPEPVPMKNSRSAILYYLFFAAQKEFSLEQRIPLRGSTFYPRRAARAALRLHHRRTESNGRLAEAMWDPHRGPAIHGGVLDRSLRHSGSRGLRSVPGECGLAETTQIQ